MSLTCPKEGCKQVVHSRDGKHYGVHFPNVLASKPCEMSNKPIPDDVFERWIDCIGAGDEQLELAEFLRSG